MSYDIWLELQGMSDDEPGNITYNVDPMFALALTGDDGKGIHNGWELIIDRKEPALAFLQGKRAFDCVPALEFAIEAMESDPSRFEALNPANGWGNFNGALNYLRRFRDVCKRSPDAIVAMWL